MFSRYVHGPGSDEPLVWYEGSGTSDRRWLHADERGSVVAGTNGGGNVIALNKYDEYGNPAAGFSGRFGYTGQTWLPELGMWNYKARIYNPRLGRFMQTDPIGYADGMNWYAYVGGDPVNFVDPSGEQMDRWDDIEDNSFLKLNEFLCHPSFPCVSNSGGFGGAGNDEADTIVVTAQRKVKQAATWAKNSLEPLTRAPNDLLDLGKGIAQGKFQWAFGGLPPTLGGVLRPIALQAASISVRYGLNANQAHHTWLNVRDRGYDPARIASAIERDLRRGGGNLRVGSDMIRTVFVGGVKFDYSVGRRPGGVLNVSSIRPPRPK